MIQDVNYFLLGWSAAPDTFVEKSLWEIEEEKKRNRKVKKQNVPKQQDFPSLGGAPKEAAGFWGVPGNSIPKTNSGKKKKKGTFVSDILL